MLDKELPTDAIDLLSMHTEGWPVGLHLAAFMLCQAPSAVKFCRQFRARLPYAHIFPLGEARINRERSVRYRVLEISNCTG